MKLPIFRKTAQISCLIIMVSVICRAQFLDDFDQKKVKGWFCLTGDGDITMDLVPMDGYARLTVDATRDKYNVWWATIKRDVTPFLDLGKLKEPDYELRVEAKVRLSTAPHRINFMINTQRTTNFHEHLMEFDIPDTTGWHVVSYTTKHLDVVPGDTLYVQLSATDFGWEKYFVDIDYYRADVVNVKQAGADKGEAIPYHPPIPDVNTFAIHLPAAHDCGLNLDFPDVNFNDWQEVTAEGNARVLTVNGNQWAILRWDFGKYKGGKVAQAGLLEITTFSVAQGGNYSAVYGEDFGMEFGKIRVIEILGGDPNWNQENVTYHNFMQGKPYPAVFNTQMIYDADLSQTPDGKSFITISKPVMQRLLDGTTKGLLIRPLGAIDVSIYAVEDKTGQGAKLHFNLKK